MDEWVSIDRLDLATIEVVVTPDNSEDEKPAIEDNDGMRTRSSLKRKYDLLRKAYDRELRWVNRGGNEDSQDKESDGKAEADAKSAHEHEENPKIKTVEWIELGRFEIETWYYSPLPILYHNCKVLSHSFSLFGILCDLQKLFFCEFTLQFFKRRSTLLRHLRKLKFRHPPGDEIYRKDRVCVFEVRFCLL